MDDNVKRPTNVDRVSAHTSERVDGMSDESREELARKLAGRKAGVTDAGFRRPITVHTAGRSSLDLTEEDVAARAARLTADLQRTERRLDRIERSSTRSRYQMVAGGGSPSARYTRLVRRAERLERQLRALR